MATACVNPAGLGPYPAGDPEAIRALAADLRRMAGRLAGAQAPAMTGWRGPAATEVHGRLTSAAGEAHSTAGELRSCATSLETAAHKLEADQRAWKQAQQKAQEDAQENAR